jgi:capsular polysaccharide biosynthesis protein
MENEIGLGQYIAPLLAVLFRRWRVVAGFLLAAAVAVGVYMIVTPRGYEARVQVATLRETTRVSFDTAIQTISEDQTTSALNVNVAERQRRYESLAELVSSPAIAQAVVARLGDQLAPDERNPAAILKVVKGGLLKKSDLIEIRATHRDPQLAVLLANTWGEEYDRAVNQLYGSGAETTRGAIQQETARAKGDYDKAQKALVDYTRTNRANELARLIGEKKQFITSLEEGKQKGILSTLAKPAEIKLARLGLAYQKQIEIEQLRADAVALKTQATNGSTTGAAGNALALLLLKAQVYATSREMPKYLQLQLDGSNDMTVTPADQARDLQTLVDVLDNRLRELGAESAALAQELLDNQGYGWLGDKAAATPAEDATTIAIRRRAQELLRGGNGALQTTLLDDAINQLQDQLRLLEAQYLEEAERGKELTRARDVAWVAYSNVAQKASEMSVGAALSSTIVRLSAPALMADPASRGTLRIAAVAGVAGLLLGVMAAYALELRQRYVLRHPAA